MASARAPSLDERPESELADTVGSSHPQQPDLTLDFAEEDEITVVHFVSGDRNETALVPKDSSSDDIKDLFRSAAEAGPYDIVKLYTPEGRLINISTRIPPNTTSCPYRLEVVAIHCNGILMEQVGIDLLSLEKRVSALEKVFKNQSSPYENIHELKDEVGQLRNKLENYEHLSWLGFYKALHPPPPPKPPGITCRSPAAAGAAKGVGYHRKSSVDKQAICDKFIKMSDVVLTKETCQLLREPTFDNWQWEDEEMLVLLQQMYLDLELPKKFDIEISILRNFLVRVYHHYNDVPFHNFRHCFCVTQMMFGMECFVKLPERVGDLEALILLTSCICHDLDHPGYNNIYQINAQTELALRYNDISPLENHHCSIAFRILEDPECNIFRNLPTETFRKIREGMIRCILATDMARHNEIVSQFREVVPYFDYSNKTHINLLSMVLIKVADISNEARPMDVAEPWLDCLLAEFFQQSDTEKLEGLPVTPFMDRDKITKPSSQCSFIGLVLLPLFEALASLYTELEPLIITPVKDALEYYRRLNEASQLSRHRKSTDVSGLHPTAASNSPSNPNNLCDKAPSDAFHLSRTGRANSVSVTHSADLLSHRSTNPMTYRRASQLIGLRTSGSSSSLKAGGHAKLAPGNGNCTSFPSLESDSEQDDEEYDEEDADAITEVAVSEKALKFKIATESSFDFSSSRKGSRENKSESSGQSGSVHTSATKDDRISFNASMASLTPKVEIMPPIPPESFPSESSNPPSTSSKAKAKESFFARLKLFTERLSISVDSASGGSGGSGGNSPSSVKHSQGFNYFRKGGKKGTGRDKSHTREDRPSSSTTHDAEERRRHKHRGSNSDPEGRVEFSRRQQTQESAQSEGERDSALVSPENSPALSGTSGCGNKSSWKQCSGSLDSILSKEEPKRSPTRRLMLPRFSSFVQKRTRMGFMMRRSSPSKNTQSEQQS